MNSLLFSIRFVSLTYIMIVCHFYSLIDQSCTYFSILIIGAILACFVTIMTIHWHYICYNKFYNYWSDVSVWVMSVSCVHHLQSTITSLNVKFVVKQVVFVALLWQFRVRFFIIKVKTNGMIEQTGGCRDWWLLQWHM